MLFDDIDSCYTYESQLNLMDRQIVLKRSLVSLRPSALEYSHTGQLLAITSVKPVELHIYDLINRKLQFSAILQSQQPIQQIIYFHIGVEDYVYIIQQGCLKGYKTTSRTILFQNCPNNNGYGAKNSSVFLDHFGEVLAVGQNSYVQFWNITTGTLIKKNNIELQINKLVQLQFLSDGSKLVLVDTQGKILNFQNNSPNFTFQGIVSLEKAFKMSRMMVLNADFAIYNKQQIGIFLGYNGYAKFIKLLNIKQHILISQTQLWSHQLSNIDQEYISFFNNGQYILYKNSSKISIFSENKLSNVHSNMVTEQQSINCIDVNDIQPQFAVCSRNIINIYEVKQQPQALFIPALLIFVWLILFIAIIVLFIYKYKRYKQRQRIPEDQKKEVIHIGDYDQTDKSKYQLQLKQIV